MRNIHATLFFLIIFLLSSCSQTAASGEAGRVPGRRISDVPLPAGFIRVPAKKGSYQDWLRSLGLKPEGTPVKYYNGKLKPNQEIHYAVIAMDVGRSDLQQCADAIMRLRGEYLFSKKMYGMIHFNFTSGDRLGFASWAEGFRPIVKGRSVIFRKRARSDYSYRNFKRYMRKVFQYAGSLSLSKELVKVKKFSGLNIGHIFIQGGLPGHAVIVLDTAIHMSSGEKIFLLAQSFMPAQDIHILKNPRNSFLSPWYSTDFSGDLITPEWVFKKNDLMRFR